MKTLWALVTIYHAIVSEALAIKIPNDAGVSSTIFPSTNIKEDKVHHKRQLNNYFSGYPTYPLLDFTYGPINLGDGFDFYRSNFGPGFGGFEELPPFEVGPLGPNGLYADVDHYANRFNYLPPLPPPREGPTVPPPPPPPIPSTIPVPAINLNANPIIVDDGGNDVIKEIPPPNLSFDPGVIQIAPNNGIPNNNNLQPPIYSKTPLNPYPRLPGSNDNLPPPNLNQFGYFPNFYGPEVLPNPFGLPYPPPQRPDLIPVREPAAPEPFYVPPQLYRPTISNPTPILASGRNRTANTLVPTAPVSLGSGSLGIVRLNNGQFALGSGSLGYVGNLPYPTQSYLPQLPAASQSELYPGQRPQTFTIQQQLSPSNQGQQVQGYGQAQSTSQSSSSSSADNNQQRGVPQVIQTGTTRHRPLFGPVQLAPGPGPGGYGVGTDGRLGFLPTNLYQNLPSIQHLGEPEAINNNKYNLQPLQLQP